MADSRNKGAAFERDLVKRLNTFFADNDLDLSCKRNLDQYQTAGMCDIEIPGHAIEAKAYKSGWWYSPAWWVQVCEACGDRVPVLIYKYDRQPIKFVFRLSDLMGAGYEEETASVDYETGIMLMRELLKFK
jgi:hypothetical protein